MSGFKKMMNALAGLEKLILVLTTAVTLALVFGNVITRKVPALGIRLAFTEELVIALFVLISLLASALCCRDNSHISLALLSQHAGEGAKKTLKLVTTAVCAVYCALLTQQGYIYMMAQLEGGVRTYVLHWPEWIFCSFVPICGICMILHLIEACLDFNCDEKEEA